MHEPDRSYAADDEWIRPLLMTAADGIVVGPASRDELIAAGRARMTRRRVLAGTALTIVLASALGGYAIVEQVDSARAGHAAVTVSATPASESSSIRSAKPVETLRTTPMPGVS